LVLTEIERQEIDMRRKLTLAVLGCVLASLPACSTAPAPSPRPAAAPVPFADYVALGDSFVAGPLIPPVAKGAPSECGRSAADYPSYLAAYLRVKTLADVSCSGAVTADLYWPQSTRIGLKPNPATDTPAQLEAVTASTDLVTLGIGGNDFTLFRDVIGRCLYTTTKRPGGAPCRDSFMRNGVDLKMRDAQAVQPRIEAAIAAIRQRAPKAKVVVVGYLRVLAGQGSCPAMPLRPADANWTDAVERQINASLWQAAQKTGATYVDSYGVSNGHDACTGKAAWVNGSEMDLSRGAAFHPFREGMNAVAREVYRSVTDSAVPKTPALGRLAKIPRR
jgi:lysophospholipase L1-like esterase